MTLPIVFLMGPTAAGKTDVALSLLQHYPLDIISVDSAMIYRGMDIGTGKPSRSLLKKAPHQLIDICEPDEIYSAFRFRMDARREIDAIHARQRIPLLVGGSGLYFRALQYGLSPLPEANHSFRGRLVAEAERIGWAAIHRRLATIDPESAARIHPNDAQRIQRALEIYEIAGRSMTEYHHLQASSSLPGEVIKIIIEVDRAELHQQIKKRFLQMLNDGLVEEVRGFYENARFSAELPSMRAVGYRQIWEHLDDKINYQQMVERAIAATRQLAKRQVTWLRKEAGADRFKRDTVLIHEIMQRMGVYL